MSNAEISQMDLGQLLFLWVSCEHLRALVKANPEARISEAFIRDFTTNRLAYEYDLTGRSVNIKTACSSTSEALHEALLANRVGSCLSAIVAGANLIMTTKGGVGMTAMGVMSADGSGKAFDSSANGFAGGGSVSGFQIKRLDLALHDRKPT